MTSKRRGILSYFAGEPRQVQMDGLLQIEAALDEADVVVVSASTGSGKQKMGECVVRYVTSKRTGMAANGLYTVPNNVLADQAIAGMRGFGTIRRQDLYQCTETPEWSCAERKRRVGACCRAPPGRPWEGCPYLRDLRGARSETKMISTLHAALAHDLRRDILVVDECHTTIPFLADLAAVKLWRREFQWRRRLEEPEDVIRWLQDELLSSAHDERTDLLWSVLTGARPTHMLDLSQANWRGSEQDCITLVPLDVRDSAGLLFSKARKIVLMSATVSALDVAALGLDRRRVAYIDLPSPIPIPQRQIEYVPVADMRFAGRGEATRKMAKWILEEYLPAWSGSRGLIHATYAVAAELRELAVGATGSRLVFHDRENKSEVLRDFLQMRPEGDERVLVGSGMEEGLDLAGDLARHQLITAVPRASVADPAMAWLAEHRPDEYEWLTIRKLVQASGRVSRGPTDMGTTTIADSSAGDRELKSKQLPEVFREALVLPG